MSLPLSNVVRVDLSLSPKPLALQAMGKHLFVTNETPVAPALVYPVAYSTLEAVGEDWGVDSEVYKAAMAFYGNGSSNFMVTLAANTSTAAMLQGGQYAPLAELQAITAGGFSITVDGLLQQVTGLDFSAAATMADIVTALQAEIVGVTITDTVGSLMIVSDTTGEGSSITVASAEIQNAATLLGLSAASNAVVVPAVVPQSPLEALQDAQDVDPSFLGIDMHKIWRDSPEAEEIADFAEGAQKIFFNTSNDPMSLVTGNVSHIIARLSDKSLDHTLSMYSSKPDEYPSSAVAGRAFLVNFQGQNTTITLNLKQIATVSVERLRQSELDALKATNGNAVVDIAGLFVYSDSRMASGQWFDVIHGTIWLKGAIENQVFNTMYATTTKIPYTDSGLSIVYQAIDKALQQGVQNGLIAVGTTPAGKYLSKGYEIYTTAVKDVPAADKANRIYKGFSFEAVGAGALHQVLVTGNFSE